MERRSSRLGLMQDAFNLEGMVLERNYRVVRLVAEGGFAVVYAGEHTALRVPIAIKVLKLPSSASEEALERFRFEARTMARIKHPDIVQVMDTGTLTLPTSPRGLPWIVLEWLAGETLKQNLTGRKGSGGRRPSESLRIMRPVFAAIAHAHELGIAHRDLKPSNVMLVRGPKEVSAKVLDFGIAKITEGDEPPTTGDTATRGDSRAFSRNYAAPEQLAGSRTGTWTDVHALALVMSELLTDVSPYPSDDAFEIGQLVFDRERPTPKKLGVPAGPWEAILGRALSLRGADRQANARALFEELERMVDAADAAWQPRLPGSKDATTSSAMRRFGTGETYSRTTDTADAHVDRVAPVAWRRAVVAVTGTALAAGAIAIGLARGRAPGNTMSSHDPVAAVIVATPNAPATALAERPLPSPLAEPLAATEHLTPTQAPSAIAPSAPAPHPPSVRRTKTTPSGAPSARPIPGKSLPAPALPYQLE